MNMAAIVQRLDLLGLVLLGVGVLIGYSGHKIAARFMPKLNEKGLYIIRFAGVAIAIAGALILLDIFA